MSFDYSVPCAGGVFEHRGQDCPEHGDNVVHARPHKSVVAFQCVRCLLECAKLLDRVESKK
jgi:hypothetical protein